MNNTMVFDKNIEKFKLKLENMINQFKLESISEILEIKKNLLME